MGYWSESMNKQMRRALIRRAAVLGAAIALLGALCWPLLFTFSGFVGDWEHDLWLVWHQSVSIQSSGRPSRFLDSNYSLLYPLYEFYGGTLYAIGGAIAVATGPVAAYVLIYVLAFAAAIGGWYWLARAAGVGAWLALVPGLIFVTATYYLAIVYVQGDWPEFTGISMIPLMAASAASVMRADRLRPGAALALALSSVLFFGSHNLTILLAFTTLGPAVALVLVAVTEARRLVSARGVVRVLGVSAPAALLSAWYLLPAIVYSPRTRIGGEYAHAKESLETTTFLVSLRHLFTFSRTSGIGLPAPYYLATALPVLAIVWVLVGMLVLPSRGGSRAWTRVLLICSGLAVVIALAMTHVGLLLALPRQYTMMQFSYRLDVYVVLMLCAAVLAALVLARAASRRARIWRWMAVPVCAVSLAGAIWQLSSYPYPGQDRYGTFESYGEVEAGDNVDYQDTSAPKLAGPDLQALDFTLDRASGDGVASAANLPPGTLLATNIGAGSYLLKVTGAQPVGVDAETGDMVLRTEPARKEAAVGDAGNAPSPTAQQSAATITVSTGHGWPIVLGDLLSWLGGVALLLELLLLPAYRLLRRTGARLPRAG